VRRPRITFTGTNTDAFTGTKVQILTHLAALTSARAWHSLIACNHGIFLFGGAGDASSPVPFFDGTQFTCFTRTKVQILTQRALVALWVFNPVSLGWHNLSRRTALQNQVAADMLY
jgi:hypothetical protein